MFYPYVKFKKNPLSTFGDMAWTRTRTDGQTARRTDGQTEKLKPISPRFTGDNKFEIYKTCCDIESECFKFNYYNVSDKQSSADPVNIFHNGIKSECSYFTDDNFTSKFKNINVFSVIHFNCRSIKSCVDDLKQYLLDIKKTFDIICISES